MPRQQEQYFLVPVPERFTDFILPAGDSQDFKVHINSREKGILCESWLVRELFQAHPDWKNLVPQGSQKQAEVQRRWREKVEGKGKGTRGGARRSSTLPNFPSSWHLSEHRLPNIGMDPVKPPMTPKRPDQGVRWGWTSRTFPVGAPCMHLW